VTSTAAASSSMRSSWPPPCAVPGTRDNRTMSIPESEFTLKDGVLRFNDEAKRVATSVKGRIINSRSGGRQGSARQAWNRARQAWIRDVACVVKAKRGRDRWCSKHRYAVTLQFRFHPRPTPLDVDNYVKPVLDGLAAGLFSEKDPADIETFAAHNGVDDSNFRTLLIRRLPDLPDDQEPEEVRLFVSSTGT